MISNRPASPVTPAASSVPAIDTHSEVTPQAGSRHAPASLAVVSFAESSFFPIPPDEMLAPMVLARPDRAFVYAGICTAASVIGGLLGYAIGFYLWEAVGSQIISFFGYGGKEEELRLAYATAGVWIISVKGVTPIPFKLVTIVSGAMAFNLPIFIAACLVTRGVRFFLVAWLFQKFGPTLAPIIEKRIGLFMLLFVAILIGGFAVAAMMH